MVNRGFSSSELDAMGEEDFLALFDTQVEMDEARAEAEREAIEKAGK